VPASGTLSITVKRGSNLLNVDGFGQGDSDPYVIVFNPNKQEILRTPEIDNNLNPVWAADKATCQWSFSSPPPAGSNFTFQVWDKDTVGSDDFMGEVTVAVVGITEAA
jgi:Ca2+-dependent lipid-binding protein